MQLTAHLYLQSVCSEDLDELLPSSGDEKVAAKSEAPSEVQRRGYYIYTKKIQVDLFSN